MKQKEIIFLISMLLFIIILPINTLAGDPDNPEITDVLGDVKGFFVPYLPNKLIKRTDINHTWFYEPSDDPDTLKIIAKLDNVVNCLFFKSFYTVHWTFEGIDYTATMITRWYDIDAFVTDSLSDESHMIIPLCDGLSDIFGFIINKDLIGNPEPGDTLSNTWSSAKIGFGINYPIFTLAHDRAPDTGFGKDYIIQY